jgi:hypothetical protein
MTQMMLSVVCCLYHVRYHRPPLGDGSLPCAHTCQFGGVGGDGEINPSLPRRPPAQHRNGPGEWRFPVKVNHHQGPLACKIYITLND